MARFVSSYRTRPYPPANVKVDGVFVDKIADSSAFTLTWAHRDRDIQADQLISHTEDSTALGKGVSYLSEQFGGWEESLWHGQQVTEAIAKGVSEIRFKVNVIGAISNNAIAFKDIVLRVGG
ncbi:hypothetical protein RZ60_05820 [[Haemophilus] ducreyi]|nr:hypothetical protein RZ60_05820 [[Haemophilus] ducreyi]